MSEGVPTLRLNRILELYEGRCSNTSVKYDIGAMSEGVPILRLNTVQKGLYLPHPTAPGHAVSASSGPDKRGHLYQHRVYGSMT